MIKKTSHSLLQYLTRARKIINAMYKNQLNNKIANYRANEPKVICAEYSTAYEQNRYTLHVTIALIITAATLWAIG